MKLWFLTWRDGKSICIMAPTAEAAIDMVNRGWPSTKSEIKLDDDLYNLYKNLFDLHKKLDTLLEFVGMPIGV